MLEKPEIADDKLIACLQQEYGLQIVHIEFLPLGADLNTAVYRVAANSTTYFLKLRRGSFEQTTVTIPHYLSTQGISQIIAPIETRTRQLWGLVDDFTVILYPFVAGNDGYEIDLPDPQWVELGVAFKQLHTTTIPQSLRNHTPQETYSPHWQKTVRDFQERVEHTQFNDPVAAELAAFLRSRRSEISHLVERAKELGNILNHRSIEYVLCHADIHPGNLLIDPNGNFYIVDWDTVIFAPKERDLMFIGGGFWQNAQKEALFYQGYGKSEIDLMALTYYRYERIVQDIAAACEQLLSTDEGGEDRQLGLHYFLNQFLPNNVIEMAYQADSGLRGE